MASDSAKIIPLNRDISVKPKVFPLGRTGRESQRPVRPHVLNESRLVRDRPVEDED